MGLWDGLLLGVYMVGAGGIPTIIVAWLGRKKAVVTKAETVEVNSPWLVQNLLEIKLAVEHIKTSVDTLAAVQQALAVQANTIAAQVKRLKNNA